MLTDGELTIPTHHEKIKKAHVEEIDCEEVMERIDGLIKDLYSLCACEVVQAMKELIPEYHSTNGRFKAVKNSPVR